MSIIRVLFFAGAVIVGTTMATGTASAQECYPNCEANATISDPSPEPGEEITFTANDVDEGTEASNTVTSDPIFLGTKTVPAGGSVSWAFKVPLDFTGRHTSTIQGIRDGVPITITIPFTVAEAGSGGSGGSGGGDGPARPPGDRLARTGSDSSVPAATVGIALLGAGATAIYFGKRRRSTTTTA